jgi:hypothetical protein
VELISSDLIYTKNEFQGFLFGTLRSLNEEREGNNEFGTVEGAAEKEEKGKSLLLFALISLVAANEIKLGTFVGGVIEEIILDFCFENKKEGELILVFVYFFLDELHWLEPLLYQ